jgi:hypothetical protein
MIESLEDFQKDLAKREKEFQKNVERNKRMIAKDPNEFFLDLPAGGWKFPKNVKDDKYSKKDS